MTSHDLPGSLQRLLDAECAAEAHDCAVDADDLRQSVWLMWLERARAGKPPGTPAAWLRAAVRGQARVARRRGRREVPLGVDGVAHDPAAGARTVVADDGHADVASAAEAPLLAAERRAALTAAVARLPGRCPALLRALMSRDDLTYRQIARASGITQGSLGPLRSRCLGCLRRTLTPEVAAPRVRGRVR